MTKQLGWEKIRDIELEKYERIVEASLKAIEMFEELRVEVN